jgi:hypothetical protein
MGARSYLNYSNQRKYAAAGSTDIHRVSSGTNSTRQHRRCRMQPGHGCGIHVASLAQGVGAVRAFQHKAVALVKVLGGGVVGVNGEFQAQKVQPVVGQVDGRPQQGCAYALALQVVAYRHAQAGHMGAARVGYRVQAQVAHHLARHHGDQYAVVCRHAREPLPPHFARLQRDLQGARRSQRLGVDVGDGGVVVLLGVADGGLHGVYGG